MQVALKRMQEDNQSTLKLKEEEYASAFNTAKDTYQSDLKAKDDQLKSSQSDLQAKDEQLKSAKEQHQRELELAKKQHQRELELANQESESLRQTISRMRAVGNESDEIVRGPRP